MSERIYLRDMQAYRQGATLVQRWITTDEREVAVATGWNLGEVMTGISSMAKSLCGVVAATEAQYSQTDLDELSVERLTINPYAFRLVMVSGPYQFTCNLDRDLEHILAGFMAAMRFFALKRGLVVVEDEVTRNRDRAGELGLFEGSA